MIQQNRIKQFYFDFCKISFIWLIISCCSNKKDSKHSVKERNLALDNIFTNIDSMVVNSYTVMDIQIYSYCCNSNLFVDKYQLSSGCDFIVAQTADDIIKNKESQYERITDSVQVNKIVSVLFSDTVLANEKLQIDARLVILLRYQSENVHSNWGDVKYDKTVTITIGDQYMEYGGSLILKRLNLFDDLFRISNVVRAHCPKDFEIKS